VGQRKFDLVFFKKITEWTGSHNKEIIENFWRFLEESTEEMRYNYLKFVWGRSSLPLDDSDYNPKHHVYV